MSYPDLYSPEILSHPSRRCDHCGQHASHDAESDADARDELVAADDTPTVKTRPSRPSQKRRTTPKTRTP